ncbi:UDP-N-acetylglucosamine 2-epimerase [Gracilibacillus sp. S3-1-1]|uniref:UDP-N-acetylglucosamine 2-epimerase n=1 Tax=Gracilibacillus pellucidus TaxID=3095368 RepID=A0ACC6M0Y7_9BACI|nr:UDP-N-acetylglucosamine 2-epimerase [Gracilibacillus sp. S3-1-1]MDX8044609.1 UDP-N-acetylglucosamine 2-epimerase [Gracilibacillus sp. S3-1-1]
MNKKIVFLTGTRADYGKLKSLMKRVETHEKFTLYIFATGMHLLSKYGLTYQEIVKDGFNNIYSFINQQNNSQMDIALSNTILGFSNYISEVKPDLIVVHGDRLEALAGAIVGAFNNIKVAHIEGGEVSGTIDESIRHAITKFAHIHFVANEEAKKRVLQLGEVENSIHVIGSPDIDIMNSTSLPKIETVKERYTIPYENYSILIYHPVTTQLFSLQNKVKNVVKAILHSEKNYIVIYPNNDEGSSTILEEFNKFKNKKNIKLFPSLRFEYFLTLLKHSDLIIGNSSTGIREASIYGIPSIDIGNRQEGRYNVENSNNITHVEENVTEITEAIDSLTNSRFEPLYLHGNGDSEDKFIQSIENDGIWNMEYQKKFIDIGNL